MTTICTHDGPFQADDVMAVAVLQLLFPEAVVVRSRDPQDCERADFVIDIGWHYDGRKWFDHHMSHGADKRANGVPFASAGLIWRHFGEAYVSRILGWDIGLTVIDIAARVDNVFVEAIDAFDCATAEGSYHLTTSPETQVQPTNVTDIVSAMNPAAFLEGAEREDFDRGFANSVELVGAILRRIVLQEASRQISPMLVRSCDRGEEILVLTTNCSWQDVVIDEMAYVKLAVIPDLDGRWIVQVVPVAKGSFVARMPLPTSWSGLHGSAFQEETGVPGAMNCSPGCHLARATSKSSAIQLAKLALQQ